MPTHDATRAPHVLEEFSDLKQPVDEILDVCCANGAFWLHIKSSSRAAEVYGLDIDEMGLSPERERSRNSS